MESFSNVGFARLSNRHTSLCSYPHFVQFRLPGHSSFQAGALGCRSKPKQATCKRNDLICLFTCRLGIVLCGLGRLHRTLATVIAYSAVQVHKRKSSEPKSAIPQRNPKVALKPPQPIPWARRASELRT